MEYKKFRQDGAGKAEVILFFNRMDDNIKRLKIYIPVDAPQSKLLDAILYVWGVSPDHDEMTFMMAQDSTSAVIVTKKSLLTYVDHNKHLYGG